MKRVVKYVILMSLALVIPIVSLADQKEVSGIYQGKNVYIKNPFSPTGVGFCIFEVTVNGKITTDEINSSAFEIDLTALDVSMGDQIAIVIKYKGGCEPEILNPEVLLPRSTFEIVGMTINDAGVLSWTTKGESGSLPYYVEQFRWNKWIMIGKMDGKGTNGPNNYSYNVGTYLHSGSNKYRVRQYEEHTKKQKYSDAVNLDVRRPPVRHTVNREKTKITFTASTLYEVYDEYGRIVTKNFGTEVNISGFKPGKYYLNYDNKTMVVFTK